MSQPSNTLQAMLAAARDAGAGLMADQQTLATLTIERKGISDFFSAADVKAEETVRRHLEAFAPTYGFLGEEGGLIEGSDPDHVWVVDPLDGTTNFLTGTPLWAVNIALARQGEVIAGVTWCPALNEMFRAELGQGAFLNDRAIHVSTRDRLEDAVLAVGIPFAAKPEHERFRNEMAALTNRVAGIRRLGAGAIDLAWVAAGRFEAYWEQKVSAWDMGAGAILVREAGGIVTDTLGAPLDLHNGTVLGTNAILHDQILEAIRPV
ncbi:MAG: inositol monophosphatase family protein [Caulobacter sp.]|nr:inositol monophosphatase family protein [Caulobacter sp.]